MRGKFAIFAFLVSAKVFSAEVFPVALNLAAPQSGSGGYVDVPGLGPSLIEFDRGEKHPNGDKTWVGHFADYGRDWRVIITTGKAGSMGIITAPTGTFPIEPIPGGGVRIGQPEDQSQPIDGESTPHQPANQPGIMPMAAAAKALPAVPDTGQQVTIDLMYVVTKGLAARLGDGLMTRLNYLVSLSNQAFADSNIHITLRLVHVEMVDYSDTSLLDPTILAMQKGTGVFSNIQALRKQYGADIVQIVTQNMAVDACGLAVVVTPIVNTSLGYFSAVVDGTAPKGQKCQDVASTHEIGHTFRARHDRAHEQYTGTDYGYGYGIENNFADIMSTSYIKAPGVLKFSSPLLTCGPDLLPCGIAAGQPGAADSARVINENRIAVAALMPAADPKPSASLTADNAAILPGGVVNVVWSSTNATACSATASDGWSGTIPLSGSANLSPPATVTYTLTCAGSGGSATTTLVIKVAGSRESSAACLFNWAEKNYPNLFPANDGNLLAWDVYSYRHYPANGAYLGVSSKDDHVWYMGKDGKMIDEGPFLDWLKTSGCI